MALKTKQKLWPGLFAELSLVGWKHYGTVPYQNPKPTVKNLYVYSSTFAVRKTSSGDWVYSKYRSGQASFVSVVSSAAIQVWWLMHLLSAEWNCWKFQGANYHISIIIWTWEQWKSVQGLWLGSVWRECNVSTLFPILANLVPELQVGDYLCT